MKNEKEKTIQPGSYGRQEETGLEN